MADITLVRQEQSAIAEADKAAARRVIFGIVDGLGERGKKQWRRLWNGIMRLEPGEMLEIKTRKPRSGPFHRRHMKLEQVLFEQQEKFTQFDPGFRDWLKVGAGFVDWYPGPRGGVFPVPKSIAFDQLEDDAMREFHDDVVAFLRTEHATRTLWKHLSPTAQIEMIEGILSNFGE
jgi:hypothetical protein